MALAARDAADRVEQLIRLTERLTGHVEREAALLKARKPIEAGQAGEESARLSHVYRAETEEVAKNPDLVRAAAPERRQALAEATTKLHATLDDHAAALAAATEISEGLMRSIADHIAEARAAATPYGPGAAGAQERAKAAVTLDRKA